MPSRLWRRQRASSDGMKGCWPYEVWNGTEGGPPHGKKQTGV